MTYFLVFIKRKMIDQFDTVNDCIEKNWLDFFSENNVNGDLNSILHYILNCDVWDGNKGLPYVFYFDVQDNVKIINQTDPSDW